MEYNPCSFIRVVLAFEVIAKLKAFYTHNFRNEKNPFFMTKVSIENKGLLNIYKKNKFFLNDFRLF